MNSPDLPPIFRANACTKENLVKHQDEHRQKLEHGAKTGSPLQRQAFLLGWRGVVHPDDLELTSFVSG